MEFKRGDTYYIRIWHPKPYKIHICSVIDQDMIVYKYFGRHKQWEHYRVEHKEGLKYAINYLKKERASKDAPI